VSDDDDEDFVQQHCSHRDRCPPARCIPPDFVSPNLPRARSHLRPTPALDTEDSDNHNNSIDEGDSASIISGNVSCPACVCVLKTDRRTYTSPQDIGNEVLPRPGHPFFFSVLPYLNYLCARHLSSSAS
jgi:hypothetical protein